MEEAPISAKLPDVNEGQPPEEAWIASPDLPMDLNGPEGRPWRRFGSDDPERPVLERLHEVARAIPDHPALDDGVTQLSYAQLWRTVLCLGEAIAKARRAGSRAPVAILLPDDSLYAAALFAGLVAGCPLVPLDRHAPVARIHDILRDSHADLAILRAADLAELALPPEVRPVLLETALLDMAGDTSPDYTALPNDLPAFILYTSGSTGQPKGVAVGQAGWAQHMRLRSSAARWGVGDRGLRLGPMGTAWGINTNGGLIVNGATTQIVDLPRVGLGAVLRLIAEREITILNAGPSLVKALVRLPGSASTLSSLRVVGLGGEPVLRADVEEIRAGLPRTCFLNNSIASTETYVGQCYLVEGRDYDTSRAPSGFISPGYEVAFIREDGAPSARDEEGEIWVRSRYVALGGWSDGKLDGTRFPADPRDPEKRIMRTGDVARMAEDGMIVVVGRRDRMLKINGQRVEPAEIEAAIRRHPEVLDCMVLPYQDGGRARLAAFVRPRSATVDEDLAPGLRDALARELPTYLMPHRIELRGEFPVLPGGKIDALGLLASMR